MCSHFPVLSSFLCCALCPPLPFMSLKRAVFQGQMVWNKARRVAFSSDEDEPPCASPAPLAAPAVPAPVGPAPGEPIPVHPPFELVEGALPCLKTFPIAGDGRCFFRSIVQWQEDPMRTRRYDPTARPTTAANHSKVGKSGRDKADALRARAVHFAMEHDMAEYGEDPEGPEGWAANMQKPDVWADHYLP